MRWKRERVGTRSQIEMSLFLKKNFKYSSGFYWILQRVLPDLTRGREQTQTPEKSAVKEKKEKSETETDLVP
jgi:hypothetical protein